MGGRGIKTRTNWLMKKYLGLVRLVEKDWKKRKEHRPDFYLFFRQGLAPGGSVAVRPVTRHFQSDVPSQNGETRWKEEHRNIGLIATNKTGR